MFLTSKLDLFNLWPFRMIASPSIEDPTSFSRETLVPGDTGSPLYEIYFWDTLRFMKLCNRDQSTPASPSPGL